jgi:hypothetical protein
MTTACFNGCFQSFSEPLVRVWISLCLMRLPYMTRWWLGLHAYASQLGTEV